MDPLGARASGVLAAVGRARLRDVGSVAPILGVQETGDKARQVCPAVSISQRAVQLALPPGTAALVQVREMPRLVLFWFWF